jgi:molybdopterin synthase sulfur carrier subunit
MPVAKIPPVLRGSTGGEKEVAVDGATVGEALRSLAAQHPDTERQLFGDDGELNRYVNVYKNDEDVRVLDGLGTSLDESDTLMILPAMAGGCEAPGYEGWMPSADSGRGQGSPRV